MPRKKILAASNEHNISFKTFDASYVLTNKGCSPPMRKMKIPNELSHLGMEIKVWSKDWVK
jgi:hypothetical protein